MYLSFWSRISVYSSKRFHAYGLDDSKYTEILNLIPNLTHRSFHLHPIHTSHPNPIYIQPPIQPPLNIPYPNQLYREISFSREGLLQARIL